MQQQNQIGWSWAAVVALVAGWLWLASPNPAIAVHQWQLTGESVDGLAQQYVALDSIRPGDGPDQWIVDSYFTERKANAQVRADYITLYDCDRQRYKDINSNGIPAVDWGSATADPLNQATLEFVCERANAGSSAHSN